MIYEKDGTRKISIARSLEFTGTPIDFVRLFDELRRLVAFETAHTDREHAPSMGTRKDRRDDDLPDA